MARIAYLDNAYRLAGLQKTELLQPFEQFDRADRKVEITAQRRHAVCIDADMENSGSDVSSMNADGRCGITDFEIRRPLLSGPYVKVATPTLPRR